MTTPNRRNNHGFGLPIFFALVALALLASLGRADESTPPPLAIGAAAPDFCLPGIDGQTHCLAEYASSKVLASAEDLKA